MYMNMPRDAETTPSKPIPNEEQRSIRADQLPMNAAPRAAVVTGALDYPKVPPLAGD